MRVLNRIDDRGATAVEYGLIAGLIALGLLGSLVATRTSMNGSYATVSSQLGNSTQTVTVDQGLKSLFAAKTITGRQSQQYNMDKPGSGSQNDFLFFSDGSQAYRTMHFNADGSDAGYYEYYMTDNTGQRYNFYANNNGDTTYIIRYTSTPKDPFNGYIQYYPADNFEYIGNSDARTYTKSDLTSDMVALRTATAQDRAFMNYQISKK